MRLRLFANIALIFVSGCSTLYQPLRVDDKTGFYPTSVQVDPGGVTTYDTSKDPRSYRYVLLLTDSNIRPSVFAFTVRQALAQAGVSRVFTAEEFLAVAEDRRLSSSGAPMSTELVQRFAKEFGSVMVIDYTYQFVGDARFHSRLSVTEAASGKALLRVDHPRTNWSNADAEAMYPVLNQLRKWINDSGKGNV